MVAYAPKRDMGYLEPLDGKSGQGFWALLAARIRYTVAAPMPSCEAITSLRPAHS
jgi:hypothetical protein